MPLSSSQLGEEAKRVSNKDKEWLLQKSHRVYRGYQGSSELSLTGDCATERRKLLAGTYFLWAIEEGESNIPLDNIIPLWISLDGSS